MAEYKVKFEVFEGPLDLLLYLIKKDEVDIYEVNLTSLATQFIQYIETMRLLDLEIAGEFFEFGASRADFRVTRVQGNSGQQREKSGDNPSAEWFMHD